MIDVENLRATFGSPLYVYSLDQITENVNRLRAALPEPTGLYYSVKANPHPELVGHLMGLGCPAEVSSPGEVRAVLEAGGDLSACLYTGPAKTLNEIGSALDAGIRRFSVESAADFRRVCSVADSRPGISCLLRVSHRPGAAGEGSTRRAGAAGLRMSAASAQFGTDSSQLEETLLEVAGDRRVRLVGLHFFPVSNARDEATLISEFQASIEFVAKLQVPAGTELSVIDLGGGFAGPYAMPGDQPVYPNLRDELSRSLDTYLPGWRAGSPAVVFESGRHLVGSAGRLLCSVTEVKRKGDRTFLLLDTGIHHVGGLSGTGRLLPAALPVLADGRSPDGADLVTLAGPLCSPADVLGRDAVIGDVCAGDLLVFPNTGAYGLTASVMGFLSRPTPVEIVVQHGEVRSATQLEICRRVASAGGLGF